MSTLAFVTHHSVRIKGTENVYTPMQCLDDRCPVKAPHLHCPLCVKSDAYQDPVILKAHYRVKHVDKAIEFAGLKILRCCDQCDIVGIIKGEKRFKGAHWHCYRCRNGFNRRDEAIKHYKTHFRNPQTTFQIQITQDLNSPPDTRQQLDRTQGIAEAFAPNQNQFQTIMRAPMQHHTVHGSEQNMNNSGHHGITMSQMKTDPGAKNQTGEHDEETIMIIQGSQLETALASHIIDSGDYKSDLDSTVSWETRFQLEEQEKNMYKARAEDYKLQVETLKQQVVELEDQLNHQRQLCLQDLIQLMASPDVSQQLAANEQFSKFLEQCQTFLPSNCHSFAPRDVADENDEVEAVIGGNNKQQDDVDLIQDFVAVTKCGSSMVSSSGLTEISTTHPQSCDNLEVNDNLQQTSHNLGDELQVMCDSDGMEGKVLVTTPRTDSLVVASNFVSRNSRIVSSSIIGQQEQNANGSRDPLIPNFLQHSSDHVIPHNHHHHQQNEDLSNVQLSQSTNLNHKTIELQNLQQLRIHQPVQQSGLRMPEILPQISNTDTANHVLEGQNVQDEEDPGTQLMPPGCLMEVVAANSLASLGRDITAVSNSGISAAGDAVVSSESHQTETFMMTLADGQHVLVQHTCKNSHEEDLQGLDEPSEKRIKIS